MQEYVQILSSVIRQERLKIGMTQGELAEHIGIDSRTILKIENHKGNPTMEVLYPLLRALNIDANRIFYPDFHEHSPARKQFQFFLSDCSDEEIQSLHQVCQTVLSVMRSSAPIDLNK